MDVMAPVDIPENPATLSLIPRPLAALTTSMIVKPVQKRAHARMRQRDGTIRGPIVDINRVPIGIHGVPARKHDIVNVPGTFVQGLGTKDP